MLEEESFDRLTEVEKNTKMLEVLRNLDEAVSELTSYAATTGSEVVNLKSSILDVGQGLEGQLRVLKRHVGPLRLASHSCGSR